VHSGGRENDLLPAYLAVALLAGLANTKEGCRFEVRLPALAV
jgi:hypothetical protein